MPSPAFLLGVLSTLATLVVALLLVEPEPTVSIVLAVAVAAGVVAVRAVRREPRRAASIFLVSGLVLALLFRLNRDLIFVGALQALAGVLALIEARGR